MKEQLKAMYIRPFFKRLFFLITSIIFLILSVVTISAHYQNFKNEQQLKFKEYYGELDNVVQQVENRLLKVRELTEGLMNREWVKRMYSDSEIFQAYFDYVQNQEIYQELNIYNMWIGFTETTAIIDLNRNRAVNRDGWQDLDFFFRGLGVMETDLLEQVKLEMLDSDGVLTILSFCNNADEKDDFFILTREIGLTPSSNCYYISIFYKKEWERYLHSLNEDIVYFNVMDKAGNSYLSIGENEASHVIRFSGISQFGWSYEAACSGYQRGITFMLIFCVLVTLMLAGVASIILSYILSTVLYHPMFELIKHLQIRVTGNQDEYTAILNRFNSVQMEKDIAEQKVRQYYEVTRNMLLQKVLYGYFEENELEQNDYRLMFEADRWYQVIKVDRLEQEKTDMLRLREAIKCYLHLFDYTYEIVENLSGELYIVLTLDTPEMKMEKEAFSSFRQNLNVLTGSEIQLTVGTCEKGIIGISKAYSNIQELCREDASESRDEFTMQVDVRDQIYYPTDWEIQLITQLKYGSKKIVSRILTELEKENYARGLKQEQQMKVTTIIFDTMVRVMAELEIKGDEMLLEYHDNLHKRNDKQQWKLMYEMAEFICSNVQQRIEKVKSVDTAEKIKAFIDQHFTDQEISLKVLSDEFNLTESAISRMFMSRYSEHFGEYLCRLRMEAAKEYLKTGEYTIKVVSRMVGYNNEVSFSRAFNKYEGIRPSEYIRFINMNAEEAINEEMTEGVDKNEDNTF